MHQQNTTLVVPRYTEKPQASTLKLFSRPKGAVLEYRTDSLILFNASITNERKLQKLGEGEAVSYSILCYKNTGY